MNMANISSGRPSDELMSAYGQIDDLLSDTATRLEGLKTLNTTAPADIITQTAARMQAPAKIVAKAAKELGAEGKQLAEASSRALSMSQDDTTILSDVVDNYTYTVAGQPIVDFKRMYQDLTTARDMARAGAKVSDMPESIRPLLKTDQSVHESVVDLNELEAQLRVLSSFDDVGLASAMLDRNPVKGVPEFTGAYSEVSSSAPTKEMLAQQAADKAAKALSYVPKYGLLLRAYRAIMDKAGVNVLKGKRAYQLLLEDIARGKTLIKPDTIDQTVLKYLERVSDDWKPKITNMLDFGLRLGRPSQPLITHSNGKWVVRHDGHSYITDSFYQAKMLLAKLSSK